MKTNPTPLASAFAALLPTLLLASPALAQQTQTTPPPVVQSVPSQPPPAAAVPAPSVAQPAPAPAQAAPITPQTVTPPPVVSTIGDPANAPAAPVARRAVSRPTVTRAAPARPAPVQVAPRPEPVRAAPVAPAPPVASAPVAEPVAPPPVAAPVQPVAVSPAPTVPDTTQATQTATTQQTRQQPVIWPWIVGAVVVLGGLLALILGRRRRDTTVYDEQPELVDPVLERAYVTPPLAAEPVVMPAPQFLNPAPAAPLETVAMAEPTPAENTEIVDADQAEVEALTAGTPTATDRPWLEFAMRPVRAGTNVDEAMVEVELTVGNAGTVTARDVRIATFMFASEPTDSAAFERMLVEHGEQGMSDPVTIAAGEGTRLDATLAVPRGSVADLFNPVIVADARYRLPDGSEGRTLASFTIGRTDAAGDFGPIANERAMHEDVEARLYAMPEHV